MIKTYLHNCALPYHSNAVPGCAIRCSCSQGCWCSQKALDFGIRRQAARCARQSTLLHASLQLRSPQPPPHRLPRCAASLEEVAPDCSTSTPDVFVSPALPPGQCPDAVRWDGREAGRHRRDGMQGVLSARFTACPDQHNHSTLVQPLPTSSSINTMHRDVPFRHRQHLPRAAVDQAGLLERAQLLAPARKRSRQLRRARWLGHCRAGSQGRRRHAFEKQEPNPLTMRVGCFSSCLDYSALGGCNKLYSGQQGVRCTGSQYANR